MKKVSIRDRIEGNELDLSVNQLTEVPVSDLANAVKATHVDLSNNRIKVLPNNFAMLTHLVKLDLSKNQLTELPRNFGNLVNLQYLDLYGNCIETLPVSFCRLKNLRWLDLKNNPLDSKLKEIAGDCLDPKQCQSCAKNVVSFMQSVESELERQKQKRLREERIKEEERLAKEAEELEIQRKKKKEERLKRKAEAKAKILANQTDHTQDKTFQQNGENVKSEKCHIVNKSSWWKSSFKLIGAFLLMLFSSLICYVFLEESYQIETFSDLAIILRERFTEIHHTVLIWWQAFALPYFLSLKEHLINWLESTFGQ